MYAYADLLPTNVATVQIETLEQEKKQLSEDLEEAYRRHKEDMEMQQMHYFQVCAHVCMCVCVCVCGGGGGKVKVKLTLLINVQVFRAYREYFDEQKLVIEQRFRQLLEEAIQDAVYLSVENTQLKASSWDIQQGAVKITIVV